MRTENGDRKKRLFEKEVHNKTEQMCFVVLRFQRPRRGYFLHLIGTKDLCGTRKGLKTEGEMMKFLMSLVKLPQKIQALTS